MAVGIVVKHKTEEASQLAILVGNALKKLGSKVFFSSESQELCTQVAQSGCLSKEELIQKCDFLIVLGGDGTFLSVARLMGERSIPVAGVHLGTLGFLTEFKKDEILPYLPQLVAGNYQVSQRHCLSATVIKGTTSFGPHMIVNDVVVSKSSIARIMELELLRDSKLISNIRADGIIINTPTGSTAYSLAAGGPIIEPSVACVEIAAICPHQLSLRPLILPYESQITVRIRQRSDSVATFDGQTSINLSEGDQVVVEPFTKHQLKIITAPGRDYFGILREKLNYGTGSPY